LDVLRVGRRRRRSPPAPRLSDRSGDLVDTCGLADARRLAPRRGAGEPPRLYVDGVELEVTADAPVISDASPDLDNALLIGNSQLPDRWFDGTIDELRLEPVVRPPEWIAVQYVATTDALFEYGPVESLP
jgi:hypothetical protein